MKKMLILGLVAMSTVGFANMGYMNGHMNGQHMSNSGSHSGMNGHMNNGRTLTQDEIRENRKNSILIQEKKLELRKLMIEKNINWNKVSALDLEISKLRSAHRIERMKKNYNSNKNTIAK